MKTCIYFCWKDEEGIPRDLHVDDLPYLPNVGDKIHIGKIEYHKHDLDLVVKERKCVIDYFELNYKNQRIVTWDVYCDKI